MNSLLPVPFYYLRHGQTDWNRDGLCVGQSDQPLNATGVNQALTAAHKVADLRVSVIFHSTLLRASKTAELLSRGSRMHLIPMPGLREVCLGVREGQYERDPCNDFVSAWLQGETIDGAESFIAFRERVVEAANSCLAGSHGGPPLLVAHSAVFIALMSICGLPMQNIDHCTPCRFEPSPAGWIVQPV